MSHSLFLSNQPANQASNGKAPLGEYLGVVLVMLLLAALTVPFLGQQGFWVDEIYSADSASSWHGLLHFFAKYENNMALYYVLLCGWMQLNDSEAFIRLLSLIFALLTIPVFHLLARRLFDRRTALLADVLLVSNGFFLHYATEARSYSLVALLTTLASLLFVAGLERPRWLMWLGYAVAVAAATYAHYFGFLIVGVHALALCWPKCPPRPWAMLLTAAALLGLLLLPLVIFRPELSGGSVDWVNSPHLNNLLDLFWELTGGEQIFLVAAGIGLCGAILGWMKPAASAGKGWQLWLLFVWSTASIAVVFLFSKLIKPIFVPRYFIGCVPAPVLLVARAVAQLRNWAAIPTLVVLAGVQIGGDVGAGLSHGGGMREAASYLTSHVGAKDAVICYPFFGEKGLNFYLRRDRAAASVAPVDIASGPYIPGGGGIDPDPALARVTQLAAGHPRVWLVRVMATAEPTVAKRLNRNWLGPITDALRVSLPRETQLNFGEGGGRSRVEVICFERPRVATP